MAVMIAMYSVVKYGERPPHGVGAGVVCMTGAALAALQAPAGNWYLALVMTLSVVIVWLLGWSMRTRRLFGDSLEDWAATAERA